jgi:RNA polymerase sigma-70 factor (ECF subfamily)
MDRVRIKQADWARAPDSELLAHIGSGEMEAFAALMQRYNRQLYRAARGVTGDDAEAEDVVQEAWTRAYAHLAEFRGESQLSTWLVRIAVNEALGRRRRSRPVVAIDQLGEQPMSSVILFPGGATDQESDLSRQQVRTMLEQAIDALPPPFRAVFVLRVVEEVAVDEIAAHLHISEATVRTRMHRARAMLRKELEKGLATCLADVFPFDGARCAAVTRRVLAAIAAQDARR